MWRISKFHTSVGGCQYEEQLLYMVSHFFNNPSFALCVLNLNVLIQLVCFFRFTQIVMTLTSCGQDLTSSLTYYAAFKTSRRSTTFPGIIECSNVCSVLLLFSVLEISPPSRSKPVSPGNVFLCFHCTAFSLDRCLSQTGNESYCQRLIHCCYVYIYFCSVSGEVVQRSAGAF